MASSKTSENASHVPCTAQADTARPADGVMMMFSATAQGSRPHADPHDRGQAIGIRPQKRCTSFRRFARRCVVVVGMRNFRVITLEEDLI
jgi:hypothetical protein